MIRFIYLTDTHIRLVDRFKDTHQQPGYYYEIELLLAHLKQWIADQRMKVDFILHGGDMIHETAPEVLREARRLFDFPMPVYLSIGNHDLTHDQSLRDWLAHAGNFFVDGFLAYRIEREDFVIHVLPTQWDRKPFYWNDAIVDKKPYFTDEQLAYVEEGVSRTPEKAHLLSIHCPIHGIPAEQTGLDAVAFGGDKLAYNESVMRLMRKYPQIHGVLSGHNHINSLITDAYGFYMTCSAFTESPFEFKLFEVDRERIRMTTHNLYSYLSFKPDYDFHRGYVQGRAKDRELDWQIRREER